MKHAFVAGIALSNQNHIFTSKEIKQGREALVCSGPEAETCFEFRLIH
jgi:hypothetical protein